jgi:hypothetical protein
MEVMWLLPIVQPTPVATTGGWTDWIPLALVVGASLVAALAASLILAALADS